MLVVVARWIHAVGEDDQKQLPVLVHPDARAGEARVAERVLREVVPVARTRRRRVPAEPATRAFFLARREQIDGCFPDE